MSTILAKTHMTHCAPMLPKLCGTRRTVAELTAHHCLGYTLAQSGANRWAYGRQAEIAPDPPWDRGLT